MNKQKLTAIVIAAVAVTLAAAVSIIAASSGKKHKEAYENLAIGQKAVNNDEITKAYAHLQQAYTYFRQKDDTAGLFESAVYMCMIYDQIGKQKESFRILKNLRFANIDDKSTCSTQYYYRMLAFYYAYYDKDFRKAEQYVRKSIEYSKKNFPGNAGYIYTDMSNLAEMHIMSGNYARAKVITDSLLAVKNIRYDIYKSQLYYCRGLICQHEGLNDSAYACYMRSLDYSEKYRVFANKLSSLRRIIALDSAKMDMKSYIAHNNEYYKVRENIKGSEVLSKLAITREQHKIELARQREEKLHIIYWLVLALITSVSGCGAAVFVISYKNTKMKQKTIMLEKKNIENKLYMEKMEKELLRLKMEKNGELLDKAYKENLAISLRLTQQHGTGGDASDGSSIFERQLKEIDKTFMDKMESQYPTLTHNDMRLISAIRLGMGTKEMALAFNISIDGLHKSRYRLRKKLRLDNGQSLETFIKSIS